MNPRMYVHVVHNFFLESRQVCEHATHEEARASNSN